MPNSDQSPSPRRRRTASAADTACRSIRLLGMAGLVVMLVACASGGGQRGTQRTGPAPSSERDGPGTSPPSDLASIPDAVPTVEPFRSANLRPYEVLGRNYVPITDDVAYTERGLASWYGRKFHGRPTATGEPYDMYAMTAAHPTLPLPSYVRVRNPANQREVVVRVNDRGPFHAGRIIDLSYTAAFKLDLLRGVAPVEIERITVGEIRSGNWGRDPDSGRLRQMVPAPTVPSPGESTAVPVAATRAEVGDGDAARRVQVATSLPVAGPSAISSSPLPVAGSDLHAGMPAIAVQAWWVQLGAFRQRDGAEQFLRQVSSDIGWIAPQLKLRSDAELHRLQAGPYADRDHAAEVAERLRESLQLVPVIVERR